MRSTPPRPAAVLAAVLLAAGCSPGPVIPDVVEVVERALPPEPDPAAPVAQAPCTPATSTSATDPADTATETLAQGAVPLRAPVQCQSVGGSLVRDLYVQFSETRIPGSTGPDGRPIPTIWTRAYSLDPVDYTGGLQTLDIPGPTFVYHPGDWLELTLINQLNRAADPLLAEFEDLMDAHSSQDDIEQPVSHDLNIPHNADNTNLHVHGMHVDPKQDDVTLIILPEDDNPSNYTPMLQHYVPDINRWWRWTYGYRLPQDHLPGTHWYHDHKHGATSTHVENGMAGTLVVRPHDDALSIVPGLWSDDPAESHDRVLIVQEIANYGAQQGAGNGSGRRRITDVMRQDQITDSTSQDWPEITVNGQHQPNLVLAPGQTERWRIVTAGSNHRNASFYWVAELTPPDTIPSALHNALEAITDFEGACGYINVGGANCAAGAPTAFPDTFFVVATPPAGTVDLVAIDGITLNAPVPIGIERPFVAGPGNRADLVVRFAEADRGKRFSLVKNYDNPPPMYLLAENPSYGDLFRPTAEHPDAPYWRYLALTTAGGGVVTEVVRDGAPTAAPVQPYRNLQADPYALGTTPTAFKVPWPSQVDVDGTPSASSTVQETAIAPILRGEQVRVDGVLTDSLVAVQVGQLGDGLDPAGPGWSVVSQVAGGGVVDTQVLMTIEVQGDAVDGPALDPAHMARISPTTDDPANTLLVRSTSYDTTERGIPAYVSPITGADLDGRQVIVFDKSGVDFVYNKVGDETPPTTTIHQFSLNGRQFDLSDFVGNPAADRLIAEPVPGRVQNVFDDGTLGVYRYNGAGTWTNQAVVGGETAAFYTNPGYYLDVVERAGPHGPYFTYDYTADAPPTYTQITGLDVPRQPEATTAEEWMLVNNSGSFHPFHIHINPLFLTEVGQLTYGALESDVEPTQYGWAIETLAEDDPLGYVLNNWWDVVIIPPFGYVKFRTWFNIPNQRPEDPTDPETDFVVDEDANVFGSWVYHCHILRHEDRGMMMVVNVKPKP